MEDLKDTNLNYFILTEMQKNQQQNNIERLQSCQDLQRLNTNGEKIILDEQGGVTTEDFHASSACFGASNL